MSEIVESRGNQEAAYKRPIGRFLLDLEMKKQPHDETIYDYAVKFASEYSDIINPRWHASRVSVQEIDGRHVELEFVHDTNDKSTYVWRLYAGDEQYDLRCARDSCEATYYKLTVQRAVMTRQNIHDDETLAKIQSVVEYMTDTYDFHKSASTIRGDSTRTHAALQQLESRKGMTRFSHGDEKI